MYTKNIQTVSRKDVPVVSKNVIGSTRCIRDSLPQLSKEDIELAYQRSIESIRRMNEICKRQIHERLINFEHD